MRWTTHDMPDQRGKRALVTGPGGLGFEVGLALAKAGADVILAGRNPEKGAEAVARLAKAVPGASVTFGRVDLASLASISGFASGLRAEGKPIDMLVNNAGVMVPPRRQATADGFELQFGTNHLGHFALTARLMPLLKGGRVVSLSSIAARSGKLAFDDLNAARSYVPMTSYAQSKLACLMFARELQRRSEAGGWGVTSIAAHPGVARTDLFHNGPGRVSAVALVRSAFWFLFQPVWQGALPALYAATAREAVPGGYYGPDRLSETRGYPAPAKVPAAALDEGAAARLWEMSEELTGVSFAAEAGDPV